MGDDKLRAVHSGGLLLAFAGAISVIAGILALADLVFGILLLALPKLSLGTVAVLCGLAFIFRGLFSIYAGLKLRKAAAVSAGAPATHPA
jgi:uncharacterized membrane protein HdeD (DUF308 family)